MRVPTIILTLILITSCSQDNYEAILSVRLKEIEELPLFDNSYVVYSQSEGYGSTYSRWTPETDYYQDDMILDSSGNMFRAVADSKGADPKTSRNQWTLIPWQHPYLFLRDTAEIRDLKQLLTNKHPYVKTYAFAALAKESDQRLFAVILDNLDDTTRITQMTSDYGFDVCPADLMISYVLDDLTTRERDSLLNLIDRKYTHLTYAKKWLTEKQTAYNTVHMPLPGFGVVCSFVSLQRSVTWDHLSRSQ